MFELYEVSPFKYKNFNLDQLFKYFRCRQLDAQSIHSVSLIMIRPKLYIFRLKIRNLQYVNTNILACVQQDQGPPIIQIFLYT